MSQITLSEEQFRILFHHLQKSSSTPTRLESSDSGSETSKSSSEDIEPTDPNRVSFVPKRTGPFRVLFDPDIHDVFSFTTCLRYLQPRPKNISQYLRGDAVDWYADLSAAFKAGINTSVGLWCHELEGEYGKTAGQSPVPQIPVQQASQVHQPPSVDEQPEPVLVQQTPQPRVTHPKQCRICKQRFVSGNQLHHHLQACRYHGKFDGMAPLREPQNEEVSITYKSGSIVLGTDEQYYLDLQLTEQRCLPYQPISHISKPDRCRLCNECFASGNQLHHHLQVSHFQTIHDDGTSPPTPDNERSTTPEANTDTQNQDHNAVAPVSGIIHSSSTALATTPNLRPAAAGVRTSTSMEAKPPSTRSPPYPSTSIPTQCRICKEKFASKSKLHQHLKAAHRFRNPEDREFQQSVPGRPIIAH